MSMEVFTFNDKQNNFQITIKSEYLKTIPNPAEYAFADLLTQHNMSPFLHNPHGPAILVIKNKHEEYWLDGKKVSPEVADKIKHNTAFHEELVEILDL